MFASMFVGVCVCEREREREREREGGGGPSTTGYGALSIKCHLADAFIQSYLQETLPPGAVWG